MNRLVGLFAATVLAFGAPAGLSAADKADKATKKAAKQAAVQGTVKAVDAKANTVTLTLKGKKGQPGEDKTFTLAASAKVTADGKETKLADLKAGTPVAATINASKEVTQLSTANKKKKAAASSKQ